MRQQSEQTLLSCASMHRFGEQLHHKSFTLPGDIRQYAPDRAIDITHIKLELHVNFEQRSVRGTATLDARVVAPAIRTVELDADELGVHAVGLSILPDATAHAPGEAHPATFSLDETTLRINLGRELHHGARIRLAIQYEARPRVGLYFVEPDEGYPRKQRHAWTQGQDIHARAWFPCFTLPDDKATSEVIVTVPGNMVALSNGELVSRVENRDGTLTFHWREHVPHSAYLVTLVVGPFVELRAEWDGVPVTYHVLPGREDDAWRAMGRTPEMIQLFADKIGVAYPFEKYAQVCVSDFIFGGMENTSATTLTDMFLPDERMLPDFVNESLVAHELAHQWFGDLVTCREWSHGWLNEGFATYFETVWAQHADGEDEFRYLLYQKAQAYLSEDRERYRRPIVTRTFRHPIDVFDRHLYPKGAWVLHMLRSQLGDEAWWRAIKHYVTKHREGSVLTHDFQRAIEEATGRNVDRLIDDFVFTGGHPEFEVRFSWDDAASTAELHVKQTQQLDALTPVFDLPIDVRFETESGLQTHRVRVAEREQTFAFRLDERPRLVRFDPEGDVLKTLDFKRPLDLLQYQLEHDATVAGRIEAAHELARNGSRSAVAALGAALRREQFWGVAAEIAKALGEARTPEAKAALLDGLAIEHSRVRRAVVAALASFKRDTAVADALWQRFDAGDPSYMVEAEIAKAMGTLKCASSYERISMALQRDSWNDVVRMYALQGLGELRDARGIPLALEWTTYGRSLWPRLAAIGALATLGTIEAHRAEIVERLGELLDDSSLFVREDAARALGRIGSRAALPALERTRDREPDGRVVRLAREAIAAIQASTARSDELAALRNDLETLAAENRELRSRVDRLDGGGSDSQTHGENGSTP